MDLSDRLAKERRGRLAAERLLEQKSRELFAANEKLAIHARSLSDQIVEQRQVVKSALTEAEVLKGQNSRFVGDLDRAHTAAVLAERRLWDSVNTIRDGFAVFDADLKLVTANHAFLGQFDGHPVAPGISYAEILAIISAAGVIDFGEQSPEGFVTEMLARLESDPIPPVTLKFRTGTWIKLQDRRARGGDLVSLALDITDQMRIWAAIEALPDGFVLYDREERLLTCNQRYRDIYPAAAPAMQPGARFEDILRFGLANGQHADAVGREEAWIEDRLAQHRAASGVAEQQLSDGRWVRAHDHPTPDGGRA
jgi:PAS domain-containing protein